MNKPKIFLSYSHENIEKMREVRESLELYGFQIWTDEKLQPGTQQWEQEIANNIEASDAIVIIMTPEAKSSIWIGKELAYAEIHEIRVFPILASGTIMTSIPFRLTSVQYIDIQTAYSSGIQRLANAIEQHLGLDLEKLKQARPDDITDSLNIYLGNFSHKIRSPIGSIKMRSYIAKRYLNENRTDSVKKTIEHLDVITSQAEELSELVDDMLSLSRLERGLLPRPEKPQNIDLIVKNLVEDYTNTHIPIILSLNSQSGVMVDGNYLRDLVQNLLDNALQYTVEGEINLSTHTMNDNVIIDVIDTGIGIQSDNKSSIFEIFWRSDDAKSLRQHGSGFGLWLVNRIVEIYGGQISFESEYGKGTTFTIVFPAHPLEGEENS